MSLKIPTNWKLILKWVSIAIFAVFVLVFFVRVATFEDAYYREKEGSEREVVEEEEDEELVEVAPTDNEIIEYTVALDRPRYLSIEKLGITKARIISVGVKSNGEMGTPNNIFDVGWYDASGKPGQGKTIVIDGHNGGPNVYGVFKELPKLVSGDVIIIERGDGAIFRYSVVENITKPLSESDEYMRTVVKYASVVGKESVTLITCTGDWSQSQKTYLSRQFTHAVLIDL